MSDREKLILGLRGILKEIQDSDNIANCKIEGMKMIAVCCKVFICL